MAMMRTLRDASALGAPTRHLGIALGGTALVAAVMAGMLATLVPLVIVVLATGGITWLLWLMWRWPYAPLITLAVSVATSRYAHTLAGVTVIPERVTIPLIAAACCLIVLGQRKRTVGVALDWRQGGLALFIAANYLGTLLNAPDAVASRRLTLLIVVASLPFWFVPFIARDARSVAFGFYTVLALGIAEAIFGSAITVLHSLTGRDLGMQMDVVTGASAPYGTLWESNIFGSFVAATFVAVLGWYLSSPRDRQRWLLVPLGLAVMALALVFSLSRGAWLGAVVGTIIVVMCAGRRGLRAIVPGCVVLSLALIGFHFATSGGTSWAAAEQRFSLLLGLQQGERDGVTAERFVTLQLALQHWWGHPVVGWGAGSFGQVFTSSTQNVPAWIGNLEIHALHDSGVVGLVGLMLAMIGTIGALVRRISRVSPTDRHSRGILIGLLGACVTLFVAFQATEATWLGYTWYIYGLAWAASRVLIGEQDRPTGSYEPETR